MTPHALRRTVADRGARRILFFFMATVTAVALLLGYRTSTGASAATGVVATAGTTGAAKAPGAATYTGDVVQTRWGPVQVAITVTGGTVTAADAVVVPSSNARDVAINARAVPVLDAEVLQAQSAQIDTVSGATVTSDGYITSLQSALDAAGL